MFFFSVTFSWTACSNVIDIQKDWSTALMSGALAREPWRNGKWMNMRLVVFQMAGVMLCHLGYYSSCLYSDSTLPFFCLSSSEYLFVIGFYISLQQL
jgi:hypothetical protein